MKFRNYFPKNKIIFNLFLIIKLLPLFIITHDWNLNYGKGISHILSYVTLSYPIFKIESKFSLEVITTILFTINLIPIFLFFYTNKNYKIYGKFFKHEKSLISISSWILFFLNYLINQYFFSILMENYLCKGIYDPEKNYLIIGYINDCRNSFNYFILVIQTFLFFYFNLISYLITILIFEPFFTSEIIIGSNLNSSNYKWILLPMIQCILQLEYHMPYRYFIYIKIIVRILYFLFFIMMIFTEYKKFYTNKKVYYLINYFFSICFVSVIIEFAYLHDFENSFIILQSDLLIVIFKLFIELFISGIIIKLLQIRETRFMSNFTNFDSLKNSHFIYESYNKFFYYLIYVERDDNLEIVKKMLKNFNDDFVLHKKNKKCKKEDCYCSLFDVNEIYKKSNLFFQKVKLIKEIKIKKEEIFIKNNLPSLYASLKFFLENNIQKSHSPQEEVYAKFLLIGIIFYKLIDRNFNKSLFYLEEFKNTRLYRDNFIVKVQTFMIKVQIKQEYSKNILNMKTMDTKDNYENLILNDENRLLEFSNEDTNSKVFENDKKSKNYIMFKTFKLLKNFIFMENRIKLTFDAYFELNNKLQESGEISLKKLKINFHKFENILNITDFLLKQIPIEKNIFIRNKFNNTNNHNFIYPFIGCKLFLFNKFFKMQNYDFIDYEKLYYNFKLEEDSQNSFMILKFKKEDTTHKLKIEYASNLICEELKYSFDEIVEMDFEDLIPKSLANSFRNHLLNSIREGVTILKENQLCLQSKNNYSKLYDFKGIVIIVDNSIIIFSNLRPIKFIDKEGKKGKMRETCFVFCEVDGTIISVSKEFQKYFYLSINVVKKLQLNIFKHILNIENFNKNNLVIYKPLSQIYNNISKLNFNPLYESSNEDFRKIYEQITKLQKVISKSENVDIMITLEEKFMNINDEDFEKQYFFVKFSTEKSTFINPKNNFFSFKENNKNNSEKTDVNIDRELKTEANLHNEKKESINNISNININTFHATKNKSNNYYSHKKEITLNYKIENLARKIDIAREISFKQLYFNYKIQKENLISDNKISEFTSDSKLTKISQSDLHNLYIYEKNRLNRNIKFKILLMMFLLVVTLLTFIFYLLFIKSYKDSLFQEGSQYLYEIFTLELTQNVLYGVIGSVFNLQIMTKKLQPDIIDNNFRNDIAYHKEKLKMRVIDYINYVKFYQAYNNQIPFENKIKQNEILHMNITNTIMNLKYESEYVNDTLWNTLYYLHLTLNDIVNVENIESLNFNTTDAVDRNKKIFYKKNYTDMSDFKSKAGSVFIIENSLTSIKYPFNELVNYLQVLDEDFSIKSIEFLLFLYLIIIIFLLSALVYQPYYYNRINNIIFSKYFVNFNYFRYFYNVINKKTQIVNDFIKNSSYDNYKNLSNSAIGIIEDGVEKEVRDINFDNSHSFKINRFEAKVHEVLRCTDSNNQSKLDSINKNKYDIYKGDNYTLSGMQIEDNEKSNPEFKFGSSTSLFSKQPDYNKRDIINSLINNSPIFLKPTKECHPMAIMPKNMKINIQNDGFNLSSNLNMMKDLIKNETEEMNVTFRLNVTSGNNNVFFNANKLQTSIIQSDVFTINNNLNNKLNNNLNDKNAKSTLDYSNNQDQKPLEITMTEIPNLNIKYTNILNKIKPYFSTKILNSNKKITDSKKNLEIINIINANKELKNKNTESKLYNSSHTPDQFSNNPLNQLNNSTNTHQSIQNTFLSNTGMNQTISNLLTNKNRESNNNRKLIAKPKNLGKYILIFSLTFVLLLMLSITDYAIVSGSIEKTMKTGYCLKVIIERVSIMNQLLLSYQYSLLQNKPLTYKYVSKGYLNNSLENSYFNDITGERDVFMEISSKFNYYKKGMTNIVSGNFLSFFDSTIEMEKLMNSNEFCRIYSVSLIKYRDSFGYLTFQEIKNSTNATLYDECIKIGFGFNKEGLLNTFDSLYTSIINQYDDFIKDQERLPETTQKRFNDPNLLTYQVETNELFYKFYLNYVYCMNEDYMNANTYNNFLKNILLAVIGISIIVLIIFYVFIFSRNFILNDKLINNIEDTVLSSLLF